MHLQHIRVLVAGPAYAGGCSGCLSMTEATQERADVVIRNHDTLAVGEAVLDDLGRLWSIRSRRSDDGRFTVMECYRSVE